MGLPYPGPGPAPCARQALEFIEVRQGLVRAGRKGKCTTHSLCLWKASNKIFTSAEDLPFSVLC
jgi:hypothetical protein